MINWGEETCIDVPHRISQNATVIVDKDAFSITKSLKGRRKMDLQGNV